MVVLRRNDWGALILVDERFGKNPNKYVKGTYGTRADVYIHIRLNSNRVVRLHL